MRGFYSTSLIRSQICTALGCLVGRDSTSSASKCHRLISPSSTKTFNRPYRGVRRPPALTEVSSPAGCPAKTPSFPVRIQSLPFGPRRRIRTRGWPAEFQRLRAMPKPWVLACVAEIPEVVTNSILVQIQVPVLVDTRVARWRLQLAGRLSLASTVSIGDARKPRSHPQEAFRVGRGLIRRFIRGSPRRSGHAPVCPSRRQSRRSSPRRCGHSRR